MSGHSKWHTIKHKKGAADAKRGKVFTRIIKELSVAARNGGGDPDSNPRLRTIIADAKSVNMPADNIKRAIQRGTGELPGVNYEEITYEAYGPGGVAIMIEVLTDNKNRTVGEVRHTLGKHGGNLGEANSVAWMFEKKGYIVVEKSAARTDDEEKLLGAAIDAGADDMGDDGDNWEIVSSPEMYQPVLDAVTKADEAKKGRATDRWIGEIDHECTGEAGRTGSDARGRALVRDSDSGLLRRRRALERTGDGLHPRRQPVSDPGLGRAERRTGSCEPPEHGPRGVATPRRPGRANAGRARGRAR